MTKRFCDLCGKEIPKIQRIYRISVEDTDDIPYANDPNLVDVDEVCQACANRIHQVVCDLRLEG